MYLSISVISVLDLDFVKLVPFTKSKEIQIITTKIMYSFFILY